MRDSVADKTHAIAPLVQRLLRAMGQIVTHEGERVAASHAERVVMECLYPTCQYSLAEIAERCQLSSREVEDAVGALLAMEVICCVRQPAGLSVYCLSQHGRKTFDQLSQRELALVEEYFSGNPDRCAGQIKSLLAALYQHHDIS